MKKIIRLFIYVLVLFNILSFSCSNNNNLEEVIKLINLPSETSENLDLKKEYAFSGNIYQAIWESTNESAIENDGTIHRTNYDQDVIIVLTLSKNKASIKKSYVIKVLADKSNEILNSCINGIILPEKINSSLNLSTSIVFNGQTINLVWKSSNEAILSSSGEVHLPIKETNVTLTLTGSLNGLSQEKEFIITVERDENYLPVNQYYLAKVYTGEIENERAPGTLKQFDGAVYRKVLSSRDYWLGIETVVTLPEIFLDPKRTGVSPYDATATRYLDNPSVYLGGNSSSESDVGLFWSIGSSFDRKRVDYSKSIAFRPFWRWIDGSNNFMNGAWTDVEHYYYPGDKVRISLVVVKDNFLQMRIDLLEETTIEKYAETRRNYNLPLDYSKTFISSAFKSNGVGYARTEFKRVCALDQVNNEGKPAQKTNSISQNTIWHEVYLYRMINGEVYKVPMTESRFTYCNAPKEFTNAISVSHNGVDKNLGGEIVTLNPNNNN